MTTIVEIPLTGGAERFTLPVGQGSYRMRVYYAALEEGGWMLDVSAADDTPLACGLPMLVGVDLLAQFAYLGLGIALYVKNDVAPYEAPQYGDFSTASHLIMVTP